MCKLFVLTNTANVSKNDLTRWVSVMAKHLTPSDKDGFGWASVGSQGVFGERYVGIKGITIPLLRPMAPIADKYAGVFENETIVETFGTASKPRGALIGHARMSTNSVALENSHPHRTQDYTLCHNGIVENIGESYIGLSTCDTEHLVYHLSTKGIDGMVSNVRGYYAVAALEHASGNLIVVKDGIASLFGCEIPSLDSLALSTSETQLRAILKAMKLKHTAIKPVSDNVALTFLPDGTLQSCTAISPVPRIATPIATLGDKYADRYEGYSNTGYSSFAELSSPADKYLIYDKNGGEISEELFFLMSKEDQDDCEVIDRVTGQPVDDGELYA